MSSFNKPKYCVYLTIYTGNKLPMFYIGSTNINKIEQGYHGSVGSKKYKQIWKTEIATNPSVFKTKIILYTYSRKYALYKENKLQKALKVIKSSMYINRSYAQINGMHGMNVKGKDNPNYGCKWNDNKRKQASDIRIGIKLSESTKKKQSISRRKHLNIYGISEKTRNISRIKKMGKLNPNYGNCKASAHLNDTRETCIYCGLTTTIGNIKRWHNDKCKLFNYKDAISCGDTSAHGSPDVFANG